MKQFVKSTLAVIALATISSQAVLAQSVATSKVNSRERILQVLDQSRPNDYVPAAFFLHFENKLGRKAVEDHKAFYRATNMDFVKVFYEIVVPTVDIQSGKDWAKVPVYGEDFFAPQVAVIADLAREFGNEAFILPTVYSPLSLASQTLGFGNRKNLKKLIEEDPKAFGQAIKNLSLSIENYLRAARKAGADGFYVSSQGGDGKLLSKKIWQEQVRPWDKHVSEVANEIGIINILHICDYGTPYKNAEALYEFADYPASIINVPLKFADGSTLNLEEAQKRFGRPIFGGLERLGVIAKGSIEEAKAEVDKVLENASPNFILGADCTVPGDTDWEKLRAVIDYAHTWRQTHKK
jgi:uroporphyrinogen decarboxylase